MVDVLLACEGLSKSYGGVQATREVNLDVRPREIHAVIGTNGAGKSTLLNMLAGEVTPSDGLIQWKGRNITHMSQPRRAALGIGKTYQRNTLFENRSVFENCRLSAQARLPKPLRLWESAMSCQQTVETAARALSSVGLIGQDHRLAGTLSHGQKRQLEIAMCLAHSPELLLLDEPLAGMGQDESERVLDLLLELKKTHAMLLVEHDMDAVFRVADRLTVMVNGAVLASGIPEVVRRDPQVIAAYLGEAHGG